jgi:hypothetical protein
LAQTTVLPSKSNRDPRRAHRARLLQIATKFAPIATAGKR